MLLSLWTKRSCLLLLCVATAIVCLILRLSTQTGPNNETKTVLARRMHQSLGGQAGLCVHVGVRDGALTVALVGEGKYLVHGLALSQKSVKRARARISAGGLEGLVSVEAASIETLPYADHLVNLIVVEDVAAMLEQGLSLSEVRRVLRPRGIAWLGQPDGAAGQLSRRQLRDALVEAGLDPFVPVPPGGDWVVFTKPRPETMDTWTHKNRDASGNRVSQERTVGVPSGVRWVAGPNWPTGYRKSAVPGVVASEGRLMYVFDDEVTTTSGRQRRNTLVARDAFNGMLLWKQATASNLLVTVANRLYTLDGRGQLVALEADSGRTMQRFPGAGTPERVAYVEGCLLTSDQRGLFCFDPDSTQLKWKHPQYVSKFVAGDGMVFIHVDNLRRGGDSVYTCLDLATGKTRWSKSTKPWSKESPELVLYQAGVLVSASPSGNHAVWAKDGKHLWSRTYERIGHGGSFTKVLYLDGLVWVHNARSRGNEQYAWEGLDPKTGQIKKILPHGGMTHRCSFDVATAGQFLSGSMDFIDYKTGRHARFDAARNSCGSAGVVPANGLLYTFPHGCGCYAMMRGFMGLASQDVSPHDDAARLTRGPAFGKVDRPPVSDSDWPTYRHNARRTGSTSAAGPSRLQLLWEQMVHPPIPQTMAAEWDMKDGGRITCPTIAQGIVFVAATDGHQLRAYDAGTGAHRWTFNAGGRIDCPPTIDGGLCLFGSRDGYVYGLRAADGQLAWRYLAAPADQRIVAYGQVESRWPVVGGVMVYDRLAYFCTGRHSHADGGILLQALVPDTAKKVWASRVEGHSGVPDVLNGAAGTVQHASIEFDAGTGERRKASTTRLRGGRLGILNDAWYRRPIATRKNLQAWTAEGRPAAQILSFNEWFTSGFRTSETSSGDGQQTGPSELFMMKRGKAAWSLKLPTSARIYGLVLAGTRLYAAGRFDDVSPPTYAVRSYAVEDGRQLGEYFAADPFVHDCLAVAGKRLYVATQGGRLICLGEQ